MTNKEFSDFMASPQLDECTGKILLTALELERSGYKQRHIALGAFRAGLQHAAEQEADEYRSTLEGMERLIRSSIAKLDRIVSDWQKNGTVAEPDA